MTDQTISPAKATSINSEWVAVALLMGQATFLAMTAGLLVISARTLFLSTFGAESLAYVYIATGIVVSAIFYGLAGLLKRWSLPIVAMSLVSFIAILLFVLRLGLSLPGSEWISFALMTLFPLVIQSTLVTVGAQSGRILNIQQIKRLLPIIFGGISIGFGAAGLLTSPLIDLLGKPEDLLYGCVAALLITLLLQIMTERRFHDDLTNTEPAHRTSQQEAKPLSQILKKRYVLLIFTYQMLSALGTQLVEFFFLKESAVHYPSPTELAGFMGDFTFFMNIGILFFMFFVAGRLLERFGLRFGLVANPLVVLIIIVIAAYVAFTAGALVITMLWLIVAAHALDLTMTNGTTWTSINATYQALPISERSPVQAAVEGIGVPVAYGITGVILIIFAAIQGLALEHIIAFTVLITFGWTAAGFLVYSEYGKALVNTIRRRSFGEGTINLTDSTSLKVVEEFLLGSDKVKIVLGLDVLEQAQHPSLATYLVRLARQAEPETRIEAFRRIERLQLSYGLTPATECLEEGNSPPEVMAAAIIAYCALEETDANEVIQPYLEDMNRTIQAGAITGLLHYGGQVGIVAATEQMSTLEESANFYDRALAAQILGDVADYHFYAPLMPLLEDDDSTVRQFAIRAAGQIRHPRLLPQVIYGLTRPDLRPDVIAAIGQFGDALLPYLEPALGGSSQYDWKTVRYIIRACRYSDGVEILKALCQHIQHPNIAIRYQILGVLAARNYRATDEDLPSIDEALTNEATHILRLLLYRQQLDDDNPALAALQRSLSEELKQTRKRVFLLLSYIYESQALIQAEYLLAEGDGREFALGLEIVSIMLSGQHNAIAVGIAKQDSAALDRLLSANQSERITKMNIEELLREIISDTETWRDDWTRACALYAVRQERMSALLDTVEESLTSSDSIVRETAGWALFALDEIRFAEHMAELAHDPSQQVQDMASNLTSDEDSSKS